MKSPPAHVCTNEQLFNYILMNAKNLVLPQGFLGYFSSLACVRMCVLFSTG